MKVIVIHRINGGIYQGKGKEIAFMGLQAFALFNYLKEHTLDIEIYNEVYGDDIDSLVQGFFNYLLHSNILFDW